MAYATLKYRRLMATVCQALGISLPYSSTMANPHDEKMNSAKESAKVLLEAIRKDIKPRDIVTRKSIENAVAVIMATGGSTNAVLHFLAIACFDGLGYRSRGTAVATAATAKLLSGCAGRSSSSCSR